MSGKLNVVEMPVTPAGEATAKCRKAIRRLQSEVNPRFAGTEVKWLTVLRFEDPKLYEAQKAEILSALPVLCDQFDDIEGLDKSGRKTITVRAGDADIMATELEEALIEKGIPIFQRDSQLVWPIEVEKDGADDRKVMTCVFRPVSLMNLFDVASKTTKWVKFDNRSKQLQTQDPPMNVLQVLLERGGTWKFPQIKGLIGAPTIRRDGTLLNKPGFDAATGLYYHAQPGFAIPEPRRTREDAEEGLEALRSLLEEFPFVDGRGGLDEAVALAGMIAPLLRGAVTLTPLTGINGTAAGSGKSFLVDLICVLATGRRCPVLSMGENRDELEKKLTAALIEGMPIISIDNIPPGRALGGDLLCQALTQHEVAVRILGLSKLLTVPCRSTFYATGNTLKIKGDVAQRRAVQSNLDPKCERPHMRKFKEDPMETLLEYRDIFVLAALSIPLAYIAAGCPNQVAPLANYGEWSRLVASSLVWLGCANPIDVVEKLGDADEDLEHLPELLPLWAEIFKSRPVKTADIVARAMKRDERADEFQYSYLHDCLRQIAPGLGKDEIDTKKLGEWIANKGQAKFVNGLRIMKDPTSKGKDSATWVLQKAEA